MPAPSFFPVFYFPGLMAAGSPTGADSAIHAIRLFYLTLDPAAFPTGTIPPHHLDEVPKSKGSGQPSAPPYVVIKDGGETPMADNHREGWAIATAKTAWEGPFSMFAYATDLGVADQMMKAILWNGQSPELKQGLAFCTLNMNPPLVSFPFNCIPGRNRRGNAGFAIEGQIVYVVQQDFVRRIYQDPLTLAL